MDEKTVRKLRKYVRRWSWFVEAWGYKFDVFYCEGHDDMPSEAREHTDAITFTRWRYMEGEIHFNVKRMARHDDDRIEEIVVHELVHFLVAPVQESRNNVEISTTMIARSLKGARNAAKS